MEQNQFEDELKRLSEDYQMPVKRGMFENLMDKRAHEQRLQQRRKQGLWVTSILLVLVGVFALNKLFMVTPADQINKEQSVLSSGKTETTIPLPEHTTGQKAEQAAVHSPDPVKLHSKPKEQTYLNNKTAVENSANYPHGGSSGSQRKSKNSDVVKTKHTKVVLQTSTEQPAERRLVVKTSSEGTTLAVSDQHKVKSTAKVGEEAELVKQATSNTPVHNQLSDINANKDKDGLASESVRKVATLNVDLVNDTLEKISWNQDTFTIQPNRFYPITLFCNTTYFPIVLSRNTSSMVPLARTVGLSEDAQFAFGVKTGLMVDLTPNLALGTALGYYKVNYEKVRVAANMKDTAVEGIISLTANFEYNLADISMSWVEMPLFVQYNQKAGKRLSFNIRTGLSYQYLIQTTSYLFTTKSSFFDYREVDNYNNQRIREHQLAFTFTPGATWHIGKHMGIYAGVAFQQQLWSYYQSAFTSRTPATLLGITSGVQYKF